MPTLENKLIHLFRRVPKRFFLIFSLINGFVIFLSYFLHNNFIPSVDFNLFCIIFVVGAIAASVVFAASLTSNHLLNKVKAPEYLHFSFSALFSLMMFFGASFCSPRIIALIGLGNFTGTLTVNSEVTEKLIEFPELPLQIGNEINPVNIVWTYGKQWFVKIPVEHILPCVIDVDPKLLSHVSRRESE